MRMTKEEVLELEQKLRNLFNFKRKWLDDKSGYWWEKYFKCRFFSVKFIFNTQEPWMCDLTIEIIKGKDIYGYEQYLEIYKKKNVTFDELKELHTYWKKQSSNERSKSKIIKRAHDKSHHNKR